VSVQSPELDLIAENDPVAQVKPEPAVTTSRHFDFMDGIRGLAALYVMATHLIATVPCELPPWLSAIRKSLSFGHTAVSVFIVLSGFSLMLPVVASPDLRLRGGVVGYVKRRCKRILPAYYASILFSILVIVCTSNSKTFAGQPDPLSIKSIGLHLLLLHNLSIQYCATINGPQWSVAAEWQIYFIFAFILLPMLRTAGRTAALLLALAMGATPIVLLPRSHDFDWTNPWYIGLFAIGMTAATFHEKVRTSKTEMFLAIAMAASGLLYIGIHLKFYVPVHPNPVTAMVKDTLSGTTVAFILLIGVSQTRRGAKLAPFKFLASRPMRYLGSISYSLYLLHITALLLCFWVTFKLQLNDRQAFWLRALAGTTTALLLAMLSARYIERPFLTPRRHRA
jgi:peptidoglycan/LPS O-acetylase OafA/YrhL